jgi:predicted transcriptional regulator
MTPDRLPWKGMPLPCLAAALVLVLAPALLPAAGGWETHTKWDGGAESFTIDSELSTGGRWTYNFSVARNSEVRAATMNVQARPYVMDPGTEYQTIHWPQNPSIDFLGDGTTDWQFPGTMGYQTEIAANTTETDMRWESAGLTKNLDLRLPKCTVNQFSLGITNAQTTKFSYSMAIGDQPVWSRDSLSFAYDQTSFTTGALNYVTTADINGDGLPDLIGCGGSGKVYVAVNRNGHFNNATVIDCQVASAQKDMLMVAAGDLDGNPGVDLAAACADGNIYFLLNQGGAGLFGGASRIDSNVTSRMASVAIADIDQDGANDIVAGNLNGKFYVFFNDGGAQFDTSGGPGSDSFKVVNAGSGQMNDVGAGLLDVGLYNGELTIFGANSDRNFYMVNCTSNRSFDIARPVVTGALREMNSVDAVDIDHDGDLDLVGASNDGKVYICINLGKAQGHAADEFDTQPGSIIKITLESGTNSLRTAVVEDVNGDGWPDILTVGSSNNGQAYLCLNDGFGAYLASGQYKPFSAGQSSTGIAAAPLVRPGSVDIAVTNGNRLDIWKNGAGPFNETVSGPALVSAVQAYIDNATVEPDIYGNPWVTVPLSIFNRFTGQLHFSGLAVNYTYNALIDFTQQLSAYLNATAGPAGSAVVCPVVFMIDSAGTLAVSELHIESQIGLVSIIGFPTEGGALFKDRAYTLSGWSNYDPDGTLYNYTWTDTGSGRLLGYGSKVQYTPAAVGNVTIQLKIRNDIGGREAASYVHLTVVEEPAAMLRVIKVVATPASPMDGEGVSLKVTVANTGKVNATNVGFQVYLDRTGGLPAASGTIDRVDMARAATTEVSFRPPIAGSHKIIVRIIQADQKFSTNVDYIQPVEVQGRSEGPTYALATITMGTLIGVGAAAAAAFFLTTEIGKFMGLSLFLPLYSKLQPEEVLDRFIRGKILGYIRANPGAHYNLIKQDLELHNGTLMHHLDTLERNGFIRSSRDGTLKRFFPGDQKVPEGRLYLSPIQDSMARYIGANPGVSQADLSRGLYIEPHIVKYHVRVLRDASLLRVEEDGNRTRLFLR